MAINYECFFRIDNLLEKVLVVRADGFNEFSWIFLDFHIWLRFSFLVLNWGWFFETSGKETCTLAFLLFRL